MQHFVMAGYCETTFPTSPLRTATPEFTGFKYPVSVHLSKEKIEPLFTPELIALAEIFKKNGFELRVAGGAVR